MTDLLERSATSATSAASAGHTAVTGPTAPVAQHAAPDTSDLVTQPPSESGGSSPARTLLERHFRAKLDRLYAKSARRQQRAPVVLQRAADKRARKAAKRKAAVSGYAVRASA